MKILSIVIVTWNCKKYAQEVLDSLRPFRANADVEVIVVDNASSDGTPELIRTEYPDVRLIESRENLGFSRGNNVGIKQTSGQYICLINPDVRVLEGCIEQMRSYMNNNTGVGLLGPEMLDAEGRHSRSYMGAPTLWRLFCRALALDAAFPKSKVFAGFLMNYFDPNEVADVDILNGWFWMARRKAVEEVGLLDENLFMYADDLDWSKRFLDKGWRVVYFPRAASIHYGAGATSSAPIRFSIEMQRSNYQYWKKNYGWASQIVYLAILSLHQVVRLAGYTIILPFRVSRWNEIVLKIRRSVACLNWALTVDNVSARRAPVVSEIN